MASVDERIVSMKFDNSAFEARMAETMKSLDKLKTSLDFSNSKRSIEDLSNAGKNFSLHGMTDAIEGVSGKFLAMSTVAITAMATIVSHAISAGARVASAFTIKPITEGFQEYETQLNSVQTILANTASKGTNLDQVNDALQKLNTYSDQTIYNFGQMAKNIGTFTAAGVDLDTSVQSIKGIANLAAMSGSTSDQASTAMYQLSQAISAGSLKLMDWNSVVNAGMGGEAFKTALFETGKAMGKLTDVPMGQSFKEWEASGHSFRESLEKGWITADVLTTTLSGFTGDLTADMLTAKGYTQEQADQIVKTAAMAKAAATEVKTFTQLLGTVKEAVGTGWADSFKIIIGNFTEAKELWTGVNNAIGTFVGKNADARNALLQGWKDLGGRTDLIEGLKAAFQAIGAVLKPIKEAFREIFPPATAQSLANLTKSFREFMEHLKIGGETADKIKRTFAGLFSIISIGFSIFKGLVIVIGNIVGALLPAGGGFLNLTAKVGDFLVHLNEMLVKSGAIQDFFNKIGNAARKPIEYIQGLIVAIKEFFDTGSGAAAVEETMGRVDSRLDHLKGVADKVQEAWKNLQDRFQAVGEVFDKVWDYIKNWFSELGNKLAKAFQPGDFNAAVDIVNVGLLGGIAVMLKKFLKNGLDINIGDGVVDKIKSALDGVTGSLKAMETNLKAEALLKIAGAMALLTVSIVALSLIDSGSLTKSLTAITVGFAQLIGTMTAMDKLVGSAGSAAKVGILAGALIALSIAMAILSVAIANLSRLGWEELAKGLAGVGGGLAIMLTAVQFMTTDTEGLITAGLAILVISAGLWVLSKAMQSFATMSWADIGKGLVGVAAGLGLITLALNFMPAASVLSGLGFIEIAVGLNILAGALKLFSMFSWADMLKGMVGIGAGLLIIAGAMQLMPLTLPITAAGMVILSGALVILAGAVAAMGALDLGTLAKGIGAFFVMLLILSAAMEAMQTAALGAAAMVVVAGALTIFAAVIGTLGSMDIMTLVKGLGAIAGVMIILGLSAAVLQPLIPAMLGLGIAMGLVGVSFALFGTGVFLVAKAFETMAKAGVAGAKAFVESIQIMIGAVPAIVGAVALAIVGIGNELLAAMPLMIRLITAVLDQLLDTIIQLTPKIALAFAEIVLAGLALIRTIIPDLVQTGVEVIEALLTGIRDNIESFVVLGGEIIVNFCNSLAEQMPTIVAAAVNLITTFLTELGLHMAEITMAGLNLLIGFIAGIAQNIWMITAAVVNLITQFLATLTGSALQIISAGAQMLVLLLQGIASNMFMIGAAVTSIIIEFITQMTNNALLIINAGTDMLIKLLQGITDNLIKITDAVASVITELITQIGKKAEDISRAGADALVDFLDGFGKDVTRMMTAGTDMMIKILEGAASNAVGFANRAGDILVSFLNGLAAAIETHSGAIRDAGWRIAMAIADGMTGGLASKAGDIANKAKDIAGGAVNAVGSVIGAIGCPAKVFINFGENMGIGLVMGMEKQRTSVARTSAELGNTAVSKMQKSLNQIPQILSGMDEFNPTITPVLDLSLIRSGVKGIDPLMKAGAISPAVSFDKARLISTTGDFGRPIETITPPVQPTVSFEQNIYSPTELSTNDIYRNTKSQIVLAKEKLGIS